MNINFIVLFSKFFLLSWCQWFEKIFTFNDDMMKNLWHEEKKQMFFWSKNRTETIIYSNSEIGYVTWLIEAMLRDWTACVSLSSKSFIDIHLELRRRLLKVTSFSQINLSFYSWVTPLFLHFFDHLGNETLGFDLL